MLPVCNTLYVALMIYFIIKATYNVALMIYYILKKIALYYQLEQMVEDLRSALEDNIKNSGWLDKETKYYALLKVSLIKKLFGIMCRKILSNI